MAKPTLVSTSFWGSLNEFTNSSRDSLVWTEPLLPYHSPPFFHGCLLRQAWLKRADFSSYEFLSMCCRTSKPQQIVELWNLVGSLVMSWPLCEATLLSLSVLCHTEKSIKIIFLVCARTHEFFSCSTKNLAHASNSNKLEPLARHIKYCWLKLSDDLTVSLSHKKIQSKTAYASSYKCRGATHVKSRLYWRRTWLT